MLYGLDNPTEVAIMARKRTKIEEVSAESLAIADIHTLKGLGETKRSKKGAERGSSSDVAPHRVSPLHFIHNNTSVNFTISGLRWHVSFTYTYR